MAIYGRPEARRLLSKILEEGCVYAPGSGADGLLGEMAGLGIVREVSRESWLRDPRTGSTSFKLLSSCPYCGSSDIAKEELMEHVGCGYVGRASDFLKACPRCGRPAELRRVGSWFYCRSCGRSFRSPRVMASSDGGSVPLEDLEPVVVARYELNPELLEEVRSVLSLYSRLEERLRSLGYSLEEDASVNGASGIPQRFDIVARAPGRSLYVDVVIAESSPLLLAEVMGRFVKYFDAAQGSNLLLVTVPMGDLPRLLLGGCCPGRIRLVGGDALEEAVEAVEALEARGNAPPDTFVYRA